MSYVSIHADIKAHWEDGQAAYSPSNAEELTLYAIDLLVRDLGPEAAHSFVEQILAKYAHGTVPPTDQSSFCTVAT